MTSTRAKNLILGALVADTAAMGLHWIYDQDRIRHVAPDTPEFIAPDRANFDGVPSYFAHETRATGQTSHYGEQTLVMLTALAENNGAYDAQTFATRFRKHFGYGGAWVGYIDHATRETLNNFQRAEDEALTHAHALAWDGNPMVTTALVTKALAWIPLLSGDALRTKFEEAVRLTHDDDAVVAHGFKVLEAVSAAPPRFGAVDEQMSATAKLPGLIATLEGADDTAFQNAVGSALRATNDHPNANDLGQVCARMMQTALHTDDVNSIIDAGHTAGSPLAQKLIEQARGMTAQDNTAVTKHFGMACDLRYGVPSVIHNMLTAPSFAEAIRRNIYSGGDTCGRAIILGAILGAAYGVGGDKGIPTDWIDQMDIDPAVLDNLR